MLDEFEAHMFHHWARFSGDYTPTTTAEKFFDGFSEISTNSNGFQ